MNKILTPDFFDRPVLEVCPELLWKYIVVWHDGQTQAYQITEIEAYDGPDDQACHARVGKTERNAVMFWPAGRRYVYLIYGMYWMLNIVTGPWDHPSAILIRGVKWYDGPWKLTKNLWIDKKFNNKIASPENWLRIEDRGDVVKNYKTDKRIWIDYAWYWAHKHRRFILED